MRPNPKPYFNLAARIDAETHERRRRIETVCQFSTPRILAAVFRHVENSVVKALSTTEKRAYLDGKYEVCREAFVRNLTALREQ